MKIINVNSDCFNSPITVKNALIRLKSDRLEITAQNAIKKKLYISNTLAENEKKDITKNIGICLENCENVTFDGGGAEVLCRGKFTQLAIINCKNITVKNFKFDYLNPTVTEMKITEVGNGYFKAVVNSDCPYRIENGKIFFYGDNFEFSDGISQIFRPSSGKTWRYYSPLQDETAVWSEEKGVITVTAKRGENPYSLCKGDILQMRNPIRDENGILIDKSQNVTIEDVTMNFMHGLGLIAQNSDTVTVNRIKCIPSEGRSCACFADFLHFSGCRGKITVTNSTFLGAHDDAVNIHGTHLLIKEVRKDGLLLRFMQPQTFGIGGFETGDSLEIVNPDSLLCTGSAVVSEAETVNPYEIFVNTETRMGEIKEGYFVENISATAGCYIANNHFERIPTRGILYSSRKPAVIENNVFTKLNSAGVLIADDAKSWFESGPVRNVKIIGNKFSDCADTVFKIAPENTEINPDLPVHSGIRIEKNEIIYNGKLKILQAKSTRGIILKNNSVFGENTVVNVELNACSDVEISENRLNGEEIDL